MLRWRRRTAAGRPPPTIVRAVQAHAIAWGPPRVAQVEGSDVPVPKETAVTMKPQAVLARPIKHTAGSEQARGPSPTCMQDAGRACGEGECHAPILSRQNR